MKPKYGYYDVFVRTCAKYPSETAIKVYEDGNYTSYAYSELYGVCEYIVQNIQQVTCDKGIIGLLTDRNPLVPSLIAACHKCSITFMFIDPSQDIQIAIRDTKLSIIIHVRNLNQSKTDLCIKIPDKNITVFNHEISIYKLQSDSQFSNFIQEHSFIAKTSGSTGDAKYIQVPIRCLQPNVDDLTNIFNITSNDVIYFSTPLTFDPSMVEILLACTNGATLLIAPEKADVLFSNNKENSVTFWQTTPSKFFQYSDANIRGKILGAESTLKVLALGGEPLSGSRRLKELKDVANETRIYTLYGVTEMSCWACVAELDLNKITDDNEVPLGNCLSETELFVKKDTENIGNIILVSKTRKCVILSNTEKVAGDSEALDTGDIGEIRNGTVYYRGRRDDVIKRFGNKF
ncbi:beta-alanine-activating enzyme isoform X2 [Aricia agestis]|uniref:beta-alanine-activating enzyme isoform X2 n=1 Tax=Aricia agestis TaxID=91739 RepID=UPI001C203B7A|nr:beta-alanine-activating enzyme isoform X2 [Aricia agestis]